MKSGIDRETRKFRLVRRRQHPDSSGIHWSVYMMPEGDWGAECCCTLTDGFETKEVALEWVCREFDKAISEGCLKFVEIP